MTASLVAEPPAAWAGNPQEQLAQALFDEARLLMEQGRYPEACPKLAESQRLDPGGGTLLNLAICHEKEGKLATAKADYDEALAAAIRDGRGDRQQIARMRATSLDPMVPRIRIVVPAATDIEALEIKLDGLVLRRAAWGIATPVDPGTHHVEANAPGRSPWSSAVVIGPAQRKTVEVPQLAPLAMLPRAEGTWLTSATGDTSRSDDTVPGSPPMVVTEPPSDSTSPEIVPTRTRANPVYYTALTLMLVGGGASLLTGVLAWTAQRDAKSGCLPDRDYCRDADSADSADRARAFAWVSTISLGVATISAITMLIAPPRIATRAPSYRAEVSTTRGGASLGITGSF